MLALTAISGLQPAPTGKQEGSAEAFTVLSPEPNPADNWCITKRVYPALNPIVSLVSV